MNLSTTPPHTTRKPSVSQILVIHSYTYVNIEPLTVPSPYQPYLAIALLQPNMGTKIMAIAAYIPQPTTTQRKLDYQAPLQWLAR